METSPGIFLRYGASIRWSSALLAGLGAGVVVGLLSHGIPWFTSGAIAPAVMGRYLAPPETVNPVWNVITLFSHGVVSLVYGILIAFAASKLKGLLALAAGGLAAMLLYLVNFLAFTYLVQVPWTASESAVLLTHIVFGFLSAGLYKGLSARKSPV
jgi:hypothetical protein